MRVTIDLAPPCRSFGPDEAVVVVDVIRSMTTAATAVALGRRCFPVPSPEAAWRLAPRLPEPLLCGELGGDRAPGFEITNSPYEISRRRDVWRPLVLLSSSGTRLLYDVRHAGAVYLACLRNYGAVARHLRRHARVTILGAATRGEFREEDQLCCALIAGRLPEAVVEDEQTVSLIERWSRAPADAFLCSRSVEYLRRTHQLDDLRFILEHLDDLDIVLALRGGEVISSQPARVSCLR
jgi:2-phosphosulfolactate phosphatase